MTTRFMSLDSYHLQLLRQNVSSIRQTVDSFKQLEIEKAYEPTVNNYSSISQIGKQFSSYYQDIKKTGNEDALNGLRQIAIDMSTNNDPNRYLSLTEDLDALKESDYDQYINFFETANSVGDQYHDLGSWLDTFTSIDDTEQQSQFIDTSRELIESEGSALEVNSMFSDFLETVQEVTEDEDDSTLDEFFNELSESNITEDYQNIIDTYNENNTDAS
ncbi:hypothetical protein EZV73_27655 [Acidaminobacter sp. JC074]|uniref:hypothetical protein n=1 Tax=Acidaminobacter sp. JC074 TaxID=2530199 RepID=UPI001F108C99|nr:hypothetical protein [Acidaminobacter sp. JC074]MCH4891378.1 hypothetical protein [Acidaminobacter sp. JC074]